jgi:hypothetical protein
MFTTRSSRRWARSGLAGILVAGGLLLGVPAAQADTGTVSFSLGAPLVLSSCGSTFCFVRVSGSWTVTPLQVPSISATTIPAPG